MSIGHSQSDSDSNPKAQSAGSWIERGSKEDRSVVYQHLLRAATSAFGNYCCLFRAVRDARVLLPHGDPRRDCPPPGDQAAGRVDHRNEAARGCAIGLLEQRLNINEAAEFLERSVAADASPGAPSDPSPGQPSPAVGQRTRWHARRALAEAATHALPAEDLAIGGWPVYASPWSDEVRESLALRLLDRVAKNPRGWLNNLAALVGLQRLLNVKGWSRATWCRIRELQSDGLPAPLATLLRVALALDSLAEEEMANLVSPVPLTESHPAGTTYEMHSLSRPALAVVAFLRPVVGRPWPGVEAVRVGSGIGSNRDAVSALRELQAKGILILQGNKRKGCAWELRAP